MQQRYTKRILSIVFSLYVVALLACSPSPFERVTLNLVRHDGAVFPLSVELAKTQAQKERGFMYRERIPFGTAMLFVYTADTHLSFWMKNTPHPLSLAYLDKQGKILSIHELTPFSTASVDSGRSVRYALEVPQGYFAHTQIEPGDYLDITPLDQSK